VTEAHQRAGALLGHAHPIPFALEAWNVGALIDIPARDRGHED
jgi:hypothetical protein